ncbi:MAG: restriction endonuclease subunit S [Victivallales bacterium]
MNKVPEGWSVKKVSDICEIAYGKDQKQVVCENGKYQILGTGGVMGKSKEFLYDKPSVLIGRKGTIDKPRFIEKPFWTVDTLFYTKVFESYVPKWFYYFLSNTDLTKYNEATGVPSLSRDAIYGIPIILPPLTEQKRIAEILSSVDRSIETTETLIAKLADLKKALMQELFTKGIGHTKFKDSPLGRIPEEWACDTLSKHAKLKGGFAFSSNDYLDNGIQLIRMGNLYQNQLALSRDPIYLPQYFKDKYPDFLLSSGDIIISMTGTWGKRDYGFAIQIPQTETIFFLNQRVAKFIVEKSIHIDYLFHFLHSDLYLEELYTKAGGTKQANLTNQQILEIPIPLPILPEQVEIASILSANDAKIEKAKSRLNKLQDMKKGLMQDLLTGKIRTVK